MMYRIQMMVTKSHTMRTLELHKIMAHGTSCVWMDPTFLCICCCID